MVVERLIVEENNNAELVYQHVTRYEFAKEFVCGRRVLDIACGSGYGAAVLKAAGATSILGIDISDKAVDYAREHYGNSDISFTVGSAENLSAYGDFDIVISFETIEHLERPEKFLAEVTRSLAPKGILIISTPVREHGTLRDKPKNSYHIREWSRDEFQALLQQYFNVVDVYGQYNFKKWFPYSRKLQRLFFKYFFPHYFEAIERYPVMPEPPKYAGFRFDMALILAICKTAV